MGKKVRLEEPIEEINIMPLMNIIMLLIPFLILSTEFIKIGVINVAAPKLSTGQASQTEPEKKPDKPPLNLTISVTEKGLTLLTRGKKIADGCLLDAQTTEQDSITVKKVGNKHNYQSLTQCLKKIKDLFKEEKRVIIMGEPEIRYEIVVELMDASRDTGKNDPKTGKPEELFSEVVLSAGVL